MLIRWIALSALAAALTGCAGAPMLNSQADPLWNSGTWNSVLGYHGPANATVVGGPSH